MVVVVAMQFSVVDMAVNGGVGRRAGFCDCLSGHCAI